jgi:DNA-directed RNA polymerase alpha subunit
MLISCKESRIENNRSFYGCFYLGPFGNSQSLTVANALRRSLLSEISGLAIVSVQIENVNNEYSTLPGVKDSVLDILLNLKEVVFKKSYNPKTIYKTKGVSSIYNALVPDDVDSSGVSSGQRKSLPLSGNMGTFFKPVLGYLKVKGPGVIRAKDLRLPPFIQCVDPSQYIATLAEDGILNIVFVIMEGKNYIVQKSPMMATSPRFQLDDSLTGTENVLIAPTGLKRHLLLNQLKELMKGEKNSALKPVGSNKGKKSVLKEKNNTPSGKSLTGIGSLENGPALRDFSSGRSGIGKFEKNEGETAMLPTSSFSLNSTSLHLDAVFSPVTKVNYIILENDQFIVEKYNEKRDVVNALSSFISSHAFYFQNVEKKKKRNTSSDPFPSFNKEEVYSFVDSLSTLELSNLTRSIHPLKKESSKQHVVLEIWTNGSLHPRDALSSALKSLSLTFSTLQKLKIYQSIFKESSSYKKVLKTTRMRERE